LEQSKTPLRVLRENIAALGVESRTRIVEGPVEKGLRRSIADAGVIFLDPPYAAAEEYERTLAVLAGSRALIVAEHASRSELGAPAGLVRSRILKQGDSALSFFSASP